MLFRSLKLTYNFITQLDAAKVIEIKKEAGSYSNVHFYFNGYEVSTDINDITIQTNADYFLMYFDLKYGEYQFEVESYETGTDPDMPVMEIPLWPVRDELEGIHKQLYIVTAENKKEYEEATGYDEDGKKYNYIKTTIRRNVYIEDTDLITHIQQNNLLNPSEIQQMEAMNQVGLYTTRIELSSPFGNSENYFVEDRWGWYADGNDIAEREGINISTIPGTSVYSVIKGTVTKAEEGTITIDSPIIGKVTYKNLKALKVTEGAEIEEKTKIGETSGSKLYLQYDKFQVENTNPVFYLEGAYYNPGTGTGNTAIVQTAISQSGNLGRKYIQWAVGGGSHQWCVMFVRWCAAQHGYDKTGIFPTQKDINDGINVVSGISEFYKKRKLWQPGGRSRGTYTPKPGDFIIFEWQGQSNDEDHIGIVEKYENGYVYTIEGNTGGGGTSDTSIVKRKKYPINSNVIIGYCTPQY